MSDLETRFKKAVYLIRNGPPKSSDNETKLSFYKVPSSALPLAGFCFF